jgi:hypothetical protein
MWQYTTETIINSNKGHLGADKTKRFDVQAGKLLIEGVGAFDIDTIKKSGKVWKRAYQPALPAKAKLTIPAITKGEYYRLQVWVSEEGTIRPELQNAMMMKSLPFHFEVKATDNAAKLAEDLAKAVKKMFLKKGSDRLFTVTDASGVLTFEASDCYVRFDEIRLDKINDSDSKNGSLTGYKDYEDVVVLNKEELGTAPNIRGTEGNGTVARLVKNLRLPTKVSLDPFGADHGGKPVPGGQYSQYMFEYITDRSHVGHQVFGSVGDQSLTTHILFIEGYDVENGKATGAAAEFEKLLTDNGITWATYAPEGDYTGKKNAAAIASAQEGRGAKK